MRSTALGKNVIGQTLSVAAGGAVGAIVGRETNNLLQPLVSKATGEVIQVWDEVNSNFRNTVKTWTGTGGFNPNNMNENLVTKSIDDDGNILLTYANGETRLYDANKQLIKVLPGNPSLIQQAKAWINNVFGDPAQATPAQLGGPIGTGANGNVEPLVGDFWTNPYPVAGDSGDSFIG